jgi:NADH:ubiquinone oxidoreductase subunit E
MARTQGQHSKPAPQAAPDALDNLIAGYREGTTAVIGLLQDVHHLYGYLPEEALERVSERLGVPMSRLYSLATFYSSFRLTPRGRHRVCVCVGTACHVKGSARIVEGLERDLGVRPGETTADGEFTVETVNCLGACALAPLIIVDEEYHGRMDPKKASRAARDAAAGTAGGGGEGTVPAA